MRYDKVWINADIAVFDKDRKLVLQKDSFLAIKNKKIKHIGSMIDFDKSKTAKVIDVKGKLITSSLIDCHTHLIYGGDRNDEIEQRREGATYEQIAKSGGGINSTIRSTREESFESIYKNSAKRLEALLKEGVGVVEIKTGYGLDLKTETKMLKIAQKLELNYPVKIVKTFLGAHSVPSEYKNDADYYIDYICDYMLDEVNDLGLIDCVDAYCEHLAFSVLQVKRVFEKAKSLGLHVRIHAEQFSLMGATKLAAKFNALSSDHLEQIDESSIKEMAKKDMIAVLLPGAYYFLRETNLPPIELFRKHGVKMAIATDLNPGTSPLASLLLMLNMGSVVFGLSVDEAFLAVTKNAACALDLQNSKGSLEVGFDADFCVWDVSHPRDLVCAYLPNALDYRVQGGEKANVC